MMEQLPLPFKQFKVKALASLFYRWFGFFHSEEGGLEWSENQYNSMDFILYLSKDFKRYDFLHSTSPLVKKTKFKIIVSDEKLRHIRTDSFCNILSENERIERQGKYDPRDILRYIEEEEDV